MCTIRPLVHCKHGPTTGISRYLGHLLWSLFYQITGCRIFTNGADLVQTFETYANSQCLLRSTTRFVSLNISDVSMKFSHELMIKALEHFLVNYGTQEQMEDLSIETIVRLVRVVLTNQFFVYRNKLYQQTTGVLSNCLLNIPLTWIYMCYIQPAWISVLSNQKKQNELFGR